MNGPFKVGQICLWQNIPGPLSYFNGQECEVIEDLAPRLVRDPAGAVMFLPVYVVRFEGKNWTAEPHNLRPKRPPQTFTGEQRIRELFTPAPAKELEPA